VKFPSSGNPPAGVFHTADDLQPSKEHNKQKVTLNNSWDYRTNGLYRTPNPGPFVLWPCTPKAR